MDRQLESLREQRLHHQPHLIFRGIAGRLRFDFERIGRGPFRQLRKRGPGQIGKHLVGKDDARDKWKGCGEAPSRALGVAGISEDATSWFA